MINLLRLHASSPIGDSAQSPGAPDVHTARERSRAALAFASFAAVFAWRGTGACHDGLSASAEVRALMVLMHQGASPKIRRLGRRLGSDRACSQLCGVYRPTRVTHSVSKIFACADRCGARLLDGRDREQAGKDRDNAELHLVVLQSSANVS
ncbi:hypothetical protein IE81DRAFT_204112 [Ceraceosorus guamensis]|uniref:Uncharacterized protein n=1 Tax=Ceraceosorus guamensis TaxID=1522189 RepID=A0A316VSW5_9BASI|nr:hypothetical protein IE81DRAFT_204112 [Ceraceosorus guamensis]PWN40729.1 hypothetical protein IE81DRAFT_204112 [Ceraceosorus guamensis]